MDLLPPRGSNRVTQWQTSRVSQPKGSRDHPNDIARGTSDFVGADTAKGKPWNKNLCHSSHHGDFPTDQLSKKQVNPYQSPPAKKRRLKSNPCKSHMNWQFPYAKSPQSNLVCYAIVWQIHVPTIIKTTHDAPSTGTAFVFKTAEVCSSTIPISLSCACRCVTILKRKPHKAKKGKWNTHEINHTDCRNLRM